MHDAALQNVDGVELALELANGLSQWRRGRLIAAPSTPPQVQSAVVSESASDFVERLPDTMRLRRLRRELRAVFAARSLNEACSILNGVLSGGGAAPVLMRTRSGRWELHVRSVRSDPLSRTAVFTATALAELVEDGLAWDGLRRCSAERCDDYFFDRSRNASRRYCSRTCANRMNSRSFRQRQSADAQ